MDLVLDRFSKALKIETRWPEGTLQGDAEASDPGAAAPFIRFQEFLTGAYPHFHNAAERWVLSPYSVIYHWKGGDPDGKPVLFLAHYDVVPVEAEKWTVEPFGAVVKDGYVYGRGSLDMKSILIGILEGAEALCAEGFRPKEDVWFAFGGDEEQTGLLGAQNAVKWFSEKGIRFSWLLDEGTPIGQGFFPGLDTPMALFGIEEKGFLSVDLTVRQQPGHASQPPRVQAAAVLAEALVRLSKKPFPFTLTPAIVSFFSRLGRLMPGFQGWALRHARALGPIFFRATAGNAVIASMLRTTTAMTQLEGSAADNVMPSAVRGVLNLRLLPPWTVERALAFIKAAVNDDRVEVSVHGHANDPIPANPEHTKLSGPGWADMAAALNEAVPDVPILPFIMVAATDSRHFKDIAGGIFRFNPFILNSKEIALIHGHDERVSIENLNRGVRFYTALLKRL
ncbi:peptidase M20 [Spirochaetia bacterium]|nr:peptidase M20 [Spirochaetia bacterium]GHU84847.1 peptidase M20 [Spirochaetia bacterium]